MTFVKTALFHKAGEGSGGGGGGGDQHNLGWYATESALTTAHPTANDGDWAIVGATDTVWVWDSDSTGWKDTGASGALQNMATGTASLSVGKATTAKNVLTIVNSDASTITTGVESVVVGSGAFSQARAGIAIGSNSAVYSSNGQYGISIGENSATRGLRAINIGLGAGGNGGNGDYGIAIGSEAQAKQNYSIQLGNGSNNEAGTFYVASYYNSANVNYKLMDADGTIPTARFTTDPSADGTYYPTLTIASGVATRSWSAPSGGLPSQTGNAGKFLTTDGTDASWSDKPLVNQASLSGSIIIGSTISSNYNTTDSIVMGAKAWSSNSSSLGKNVVIGEGNDTYAMQKQNVVIGYNAKVASSAGNFAIAIGSESSGGGECAVAIGYKAGVGANNAIQINASTTSRTNTDANTFKVGNANGNFEMMSADGTIPTARLTKVNSTITLTAAGWSANTQTVTVTGMTATGVVLVSPDPTDQAAYTSAGILCTAQAADSLTFTCSTTPTGDIDVVVVML